jgi:hypothetical protein
MESLTRRSLLKTSSLALCAGFLQESSVAISEVSDTRGRVYLNLNENAFDPSTKVSPAIKGEPWRIYSERPSHQHLTVLGAPSNLGLKPPSSGKSRAFDTWLMCFESMALSSDYTRKTPGPLYRLSMDPQSIHLRRYEMLQRSASTVSNLLIALAPYSIKDDFLWFSAAIAASFWEAP